MITPASSGSSPRPLTLIWLLRCYSRQSHILRGWLISALILMPCPWQARADGEDDWTKTSDGSALEMTVSSYDGQQSHYGMESVPVGESRALEARVVRHNWEVWTNNATGESEWRTETWNPVEPMTLYFSVDEGPGRGFVDGSSNTSVTTFEGRAAVTFLMGGGYSTVRICSDPWSSTPQTQGSFVFAPAQDDPVYVGTESKVELSVASSGATLGDPDTSNVPVGSTRQLVATVEQATWEQWIAPISGQTEKRNRQATPISASLTYSISSGSGAVDGSGLFTMGSAPSTVCVEASYSGSSVPATAWITFSPEPESYSYYSSEYSLSPSVSADQTTLAPGSSTPVQLGVTMSTWDVWVSNYGNSKTVNQNSSPAVGAQIEWFADDGGGDGSFSAGSGTTDAAGAAGGTFTMGSDYYTLHARVSYGGGNASEASLTFSPAEVEVFNQNGYQYVPTSIVVSAAGGYDALLPADERDISAQVLADCYEVWQGNWGTIDLRNPVPDTPVPADVAVSFAITGSGDGQLSAASALTDSNGIAQVHFTMGETQSHVTATFGTSPDEIIGSIDMLPAPETWTLYQGGAGGRFITLNSDEPVSDIAAGATIHLSANVIEGSWDLFISNYGVRAWASACARSRRLMGPFHQQLRPFQSRECDGHRRSQCRRRLFPGIRRRRFA